MTPHRRWTFDTMATFSRDADHGSWWLPCQHPERPLDRNAALTHIVDGKPCQPCEIAREATRRRAGTR